LNQINSLRLGSLPIGSRASRAAARALLQIREEAANREAETRFVIDFGMERPPGGVSRSVDAQGKVIEFIFPASGECLGVFGVPAGMTVEDALRKAKARRYGSNFVIDIEPAQSRMLGQKAFLAQNFLISMNPK
jgi:hypothetical protein